MRSLRIHLLALSLAPLSAAAAADGGIEAGVGTVNILNRLKRTETTP